MNLTILSESHPKRCEVCHQSDRFDPKTNFCGRCTIVEIPQKNAVIPASVPVPRFCLLSNLTAEEIEELPQLGKLHLSISLAHNCLFYAVPFLVIFLRSFRMSFGDCLNWVEGIVGLLCFFSFPVAWMIGMISFQFALNLFQENKPFRTFLISGFLCFWPLMQIIILFILSGVGLFGSPDDTCCC